jgi:glycine cleavage system H protein
MVKAGLKYTKDHEWVEINGNIATVGITDYAANALGSIVYVELPDVDSEFSEGESLGAIESVKAATDVYIPVSGKIVEVNEAVSDEPGSLNADPFASWIVKVEIANPSEVDALLDPAAYEALLG